MNKLMNRLYIFFIFFLVSIIGRAFFIYYQVIFKIFIDPVFAKSF